jgi:hypothetical protein
MMNYLSLIYNELGEGSPKYQYEYLLELKKKERDLIHYKAKLDHAIRNLNAMADNEAIDSTVRSMCRIVAEVCALPNLDERINP